MLRRNQRENRRIGLRFGFASLQARQLAKLLLDAFPPPSGGARNMLQPVERRFARQRSHITSSRLQRRRQQRQRRIPRVEGGVEEFVSQTTNTLRRVEEDPVTGTKRAVWIKRGPDHFAHADSYAEVALRGRKLGLVTVSILG